jgi:antitoxin HicB
MRDLTQYPFEIRALAEEEGGGYLISFPDFSECISDGETVEEAIRNGRDALEETVAALESLNLPVPEPGSGGSYSGKFVQRVPRSLHARLAMRARQEGVSMNALVTALLAEGLTRQER